MAQPDATDALRMFIARYHLPGPCTDDLLRLIQRLVEPDMLQSTKRLPLSQNTLHQRFDTPNESDIRVGSITAAGSDIVEEFPYLDIVSCIAGLLVDSAIPDGEKYFVHDNSEDVPFEALGELWTGEWWKIAQQRVNLECPGAILGSIILYIDGISVDFFGNIQLVPIMMTLGNFSTRVRQSVDAKRVVGFVPYLSDEKIAARTKMSPSKVRREIMHAAFKM